MKRVYRKPNPHLFDVAIDEIQTALNNECAWLNNIFGRCERLVKEINGRKEFTANWYKAKNDYILIAPDEGLGNFCFFVLDEPTDLENYFAGDVTRSTIGFSLIVWCDLRTIGEGRDTEAVKEELLQILNGRTHLRSGRMTIDKVYERAENIFREFDYDEIDNQYLMHPFAGFRIQGELIVDTHCDAYIPPTPPVEPQYIRGHIIDGASTFTFRFNNRIINVEVDNNGWWQYDVNEEMMSMEDAFFIKQNIDVIKINFDFSQITNFYRAFYNCIHLEELTFSTKYQNSLVNRVNNFVHFDAIRELDLSMFTFENLTSTWSMFNSSQLRRLDLSNADFRNLTDTSNMFAACTYLKDLILKPNSIKMAVDFGACSVLQKASVLNIINSAAGNVTFTLHSNIYSKCASGGIWHTDIQAAIYAKAAQGFTVTLISA